jgi:hypothetical protein
VLQTGARSSTGDAPTCAPIADLGRYAPCADDTGQASPGTSMCRPCRQSDTACRTWRKWSLLPTCALDAGPELPRLIAASRIWQAERGFTARPGDPTLADAILGPQLPGERQSATHLTVQSEPGGRRSGRDSHHGEPLDFARRARQSRKRSLNPALEFEALL